LEKDNIIAKDTVDKVKLEKVIMLEVKHPFIVKMHYVFQKNYRIYFVMDYIGGGELFNHIQLKTRFTEN
jgi:serine/threonine protein kinase